MLMMIDVNPMIVIRFPVSSFSSRVNESRREV